MHGNIIDSMEPTSFRSGQIKITEEKYMWAKVERKISILIEL